MSTQEKRHGCGYRHSLWRKLALADVNCLDVGACPYTVTSEAQERTRPVPYCHSDDDYRQRRQEKAYFILQLVSASSRKVRVGAQGRNLEVRTEAEAVERCSSLACFHGLLSLLSYTTQDHQPWDGTVPGELGPPTSIINEENVVQSLL